LVLAALVLEALVLEALVEAAMVLVKLCRLPSSCQRTLAEPPQAKQLRPEARHTGRRLGIAHHYSD
jgi:hypothetical protein